MSEEMKQLAEILNKRMKPDETVFSLKAAAVVGLFVILFGYLFTGFIGNRGDISTLKIQQQYTIASVAELKESGEKTLSLVTAIRDEQIRRNAREGR